MLKYAQTICSCPTKTLGSVFAQLSLILSFLHADRDIQLSKRVVQIRVEQPLAQIVHRATAPLKVMDFPLLGKFFVGVECWS